MVPRKRFAGPIFLPRLSDEGIHAVLLFPLPSSLFPSFGGARSIVFRGAARRPTADPVTVAGPAGTPAASAEPSARRAGTRPPSPFRHDPGPDSRPAPEHGLFAGSVESV